MIVSWFYKDVPFVYEVVLKDVEAAHHLREDEHLVSSSFEAWKQLIQQDQFTSGAHQSLEMEVWSQRIIHLPQLSHYLLLSSCTEMKPEGKELRQL